MIVLDCDNTLWKGVCGEDGPLGIEITPPYRALQEFMVGQANAGRLLCLCSKNNESDVLDVFEQRTDMLLREEHFVSRRINWNSKSDNLQSLARELNLGLESFIFVDDNPVECADVEINCPGVLTLQLPTERRRHSGVSGPHLGVRSRADRPTRIETARACIGRTSRENRAGTQLSLQRFHQRTRASRRDR